MTERGFRRPPDVKAQTERDLARLQRRASGQSFWRSLGLLGGVGWPIVLLSTGGALLGRYLDARLASGIRLTLSLLTLGATLGSVLAWRGLREEGHR